MSTPQTEPLLQREALADSSNPLEEASTLPARAFTDEAIYRMEQERLFSGGWLCAGRVDQVPQPGDYLSLDLLGSRLVVVRGRDGVVRVLSRICRHRAAEVVGGTGNARSFQCPYHSWTYRLDGSLVGAPFMESREDFDRDACSLPEIRSEEWEGWIFVNLDGEAEPLAPALAPMSALLAKYRMSEMLAVETATFDSPFNWKVLTDNFMEAYHHIATHRDTLQPFLPAERSYSPDNAGPYSVLVMPGHDRDVPAGAEEGSSPIDPEAEGSLVAATVYPFHLFAPTADSLTWYQILPHSVDRFTLKIFNCFPRDVVEDSSQRETISGLQELTKVIHHQDIDACESVWSGLQDRSFERGPLSGLEKSIWQFNQWWTERML